MAENAKRNLMTKSSISERISGSKISEYKAKLAELSKLAEELAPEGLLIVSLYTKNESFSPVVKTQKDLMDLEIIYSFRNIQKDPSMITEKIEILEAVNLIQKTVGKRKKMKRKALKKKESN